MEKTVNHKAWFLVLPVVVLVAFSAGRWLAPLAAWIGPVLILRYARDHRV